MPKGKWKCEQGCRWDMLHKSELIEFCKEWKSRCHATNDQVFLLNFTLTRVIKSRNYFSIKLQSDLNEWSIPEIIEFFRRTYNVGAFEKHLVLLNSLMDIVSNIMSIHKNGGKGNGKQYHASIIKLFEVLLKFESSSTHNFISKKLVWPALNTTRFNLCKKRFCIFLWVSMNLHFVTCVQFWRNVKKNCDFQCQYLLNVEKMKWNVLTLPHGIGGWIQLMGFFNSIFDLNIQFINANLISIHHQPHGLIFKMFLKFYKLQQYVVYLLLTL